MTIEYTGNAKMTKSNTSEKYASLMFHIALFLLTLQNPMYLMITNLPSPEELQQFPNFEI